MSTGCDNTKKREADEEFDEICNCSERLQGNADLQAKYAQDVEDRIEKVAEWETKVKKEKCWTDCHDDLNCYNCTDTDWNFSGFANKLQEWRDHRVKTDWGYTANSDTVPKNDKWCEGKYGTSYVWAGNDAEGWDRRAICKYTDDAIKDELQDVIKGDNTYKDKPTPGNEPDEIALPALDDITCCNTYISATAGGDVIIENVKTSCESAGMTSNEDTTGTSNQSTEQDDSLVTIKLDQDSFFMIGGVVSSLFLCCICIVLIFIVVSESEDAV